MIFRKILTHLNAILDARYWILDVRATNLWWTGGEWIGKFGIGRTKNCLFKKFLRIILVLRGEYIVENTTKSSAVGAADSAAAC